MSNKGKVASDKTQTRALKKQEENNEQNYSEVLDLSVCSLFTEGLSPGNSRYDKRRFGSNAGKSGQLSNLEKAVLNSFQSKLEKQDKYEVISQLQLRGGSWVYIPSDILTTLISKLPLVIPSGKTENRENLPVADTKLPSLPEDRGPVSQEVPDGFLAGWGMIDKSGPGTKIKTKLDIGQGKPSTSSSLVDISKESLNIPNLLQNPRIYKRYMGRLFTERELVYFEAKKRGTSWTATTVKKASWRKPLKCDEAKHFGGSSSRRNSAVNAP